jgi:hypothetical protein
VQWFYFLFIKNDGNHLSSPAVIILALIILRYQKSNWFFGSKSLRGVLMRNQLNIRYLKNHNYLGGGFFGIPS